MFFGFLSIVVPIYNEKDTICQVMESLLSLSIDKEIIVVDDNSNDGTFKYLMDFITCSNVKVLRSFRNIGKGFSLMLGIKEAKGDYIAFQDADLEYPVESITVLYKAILENDYDMIVGVRTISWDNLMKMSLGSFLANRVISNISGLPDVFSGQRIIKRSVIKGLDLQSKGFDIETEITLKMFYNNYKIGWHPVPYIPRLKKEGKKIGAMDFLKIMYRYFKVRGFVFKKDNKGGFLLEDRF